MKSNQISDQQITASSVFKTWGIDAFTWHPHYARLDKTGKTNAWTALHNGQAEWLQVGLPAPASAPGLGGGQNNPPRALTPLRTPAPQPQLLLPSIAQDSSGLRFHSQPGMGTNSFEISFSVSSPPLFLYSSHDSVT